jgi:hypothetical protein
VGTIGIAASVLTRSDAGVVDQGLKEALVGLRAAAAAVKVMSILETAGVACSELAVATSEMTGATVWAMGASEAVEAACSVLRGSGA